MAEIKQCTFSDIYVLNGVTLRQEILKGIQHKNTEPKNCPLILGLWCPAASSISVSLIPHFVLFFFTKILLLCYFPINPLNLTLNFNKLWYSLCLLAHSEKNHKLRMFSLNEKLSKIRDTFYKHYKYFILKHFISSFLVW